MGDLQKAEETYKTVLEIDQKSGGAELGYGQKAGIDGPALQSDALEAVER